jgi:hypothetical protein
MGLRYGPSIAPGWLAAAHRPTAVLRSAGPPDECWRKWCSSPPLCCAWSERADCQMSRRGARRRRMPVPRLRPSWQNAGARRTERAGWRAQGARTMTQTAYFAGTSASMYQPFWPYLSSTLLREKIGTHEFENVVIDGIAGRSAVESPPQTRHTGFDGTLIQPTARGADRRRFASSVATIKLSDS